MRSQTAVSVMSLHQLDCLCMDAPQPFSCIQYSRYKYGSSRIGEAYGLALGEAFLQHFPDRALSHRLLVTSSAYKSIPTSSFCIGQAFWNRVNLMRSQAKHTPGNLIKLERTTLYPGDYGTLSAEQRTRLMQSNHLYFEDALLTGADLVIVDDVKVTGAHQQCLMLHTGHIALNSLTFLYAVECVDAQMSDPSIEDRLNHASVKTLLDLVQIIHSSDFLFNVRVCKFILSAANRASLPQFLAQMTDRFLVHLYHMILGDGYCFMDAYQESFHIIHVTLQQRHLLAENTLASACKTTVCVKVVN